MRIGLGIRAFWNCLFDRGAAERIAVALESESKTVVTPPKIEVRPVTAAKSDEPAGAALGQNPAITLIATLQREARLVDLIHENLDHYDDGQVGAAARPCLKQCRTTLDRLLKIERLIDAGENATIDVASEVSPGRFRWIGEPAPSAKVVHPGWKATAIRLPQWTGQSDEAEIIAPTQVQRS